MLVVLSGVASAPGLALGQSGWRSFQVLATLGDPAPGPGAAGFIVNDFAFSVETRTRRSN
jgi:hypothetical protein